MRLFKAAPSLFRSPNLLPLGGMILLSLWTGCADPTEHPAPQRAGFSGFPQAPTEVAEGWDELKLTTGGADVTLDSFGHYSISRNACWVAGSGALASAEWNQLTPLLNRVAARLQARVGTSPSPESSPTPTPKVCVPVGSTARALAGPGTLRLQGGSRPGERPEWITPSWQTWGVELCLDSDLALDLQEATLLVRAIDRWLLQAFSEDCTIDP